MQLTQLILLRAGTLMAAALILVVIAVGLVWASGAIIGVIS